MTTHAGAHHYASCGEWRPTPGNHDCATCPVKCPTCGAYRVERASSQHTTAAEHHAVVTEIRDRISKRGEA